MKFQYDAIVISNMIFFHNFSDEGVATVRGAVAVVRKCRLGRTGGAWTGCTGGSRAQSGGGGSRAGSGQGVGARGGSRGFK